MVCKTIRDGSNPSVHLRLGVMVSTQDFGSWNIGSNPMAAASHSFKGKDRGLLIPRYRFESCMRHPGRLQKTSAAHQKAEKILQKGRAESPKASDQESRYASGQPEDREAGKTAGIKQT